MVFGGDEVEFVVYGFVKCLDGILLLVYEL